MSLWLAIESVQGLAAVTLDWQMLAGTQFPVMKGFLRQTSEQVASYPCPRECGCGHRVVRHGDGRIVAVCECDDCSCDTLKVSEDDLRVMEFNSAKFARALANALGCEVREAKVEIEGVRQIGVFEEMPIVLGLPEGQRDCARMARELIGYFGSNFLVLTPTGRSIDGNAQSALRKVNAAIVGLDSLVTVAADGTMTSKRSAAELFESVGCGSRGRSPHQGESAPVPRFVFQKAGSTWRVVFDGAPEFHIEDTLGARYLDYLFRHPNEPISAFDLEVAIAPEKGKAREKNSIQSKLDPEAMRQYLRELRRLREERDEAMQASNYAEAEQLEDEIEVIESAIKKTGDVSDFGERSRGNVSKAVAAVRKKLLSGDPVQRAFGEHVQQFVSMGYECVYNQPEGRVWRQD
jgi:hypothetical protein